MFCLPFIGEASQQIEKEIKHFLENKIKANFSLRMNHSVSTIGNLFRNKDKPRPPRTQGLLLVSTSTDDVINSRPSYRTEQNSATDYFKWT